MLQIPFVVDKNEAVEINEAHSIQSQYSQLKSPTVGPTLQRQRSSTNSRRTNSDPAAKLASIDSFKTGFTSETSAPELQSITSKEKVATQLLGQSILTSAKLMNESQSSY